MWDWGWYNMPDAFLYDNLFMNGLYGFSYYGWRMLGFPDYYDYYYGNLGYLGYSGGGGGYSPAGTQRNQDR